MELLGKTVSSITQSLQTELLGCVARSTEWSYGRDSCPGPRGVGHVSPDVSSWTPDPRTQLLFFHLLPSTNYSFVFIHFPPPPTIACFVGLCHFGTLITFSFSLSSGSRFIPTICVVMWTSWEGMME